MLFLVVFMSFDVNKNSLPIIQKFNNKIKELEKKPKEKELKVQKLTNRILESSTLQKSEEIRSVVSLISNNLVKQEVYDKLARKLSTSNLNEYLSTDIHTLNQFNICKELTPEEKIKICLMVPEKERESVMRCVEKLGAKMNGRDIVSLVFSLQQIPEERREEFTMGAYGKLSRRPTLALAQNVEQFFNEEMNTSTKLMLIDSFSKFSEAAAEAFAPNASKFFGEGADSFDQVLMMEAFAELPEAVAIVFAPNPSQILSMGRDRLNQLEIVRALSKLSGKAVQALTENGSKFFSENDQVGMIAAYGKLSEAAAVAFAQNVSQFFSKEMRKSDRMELIAAYARFPDAAAEAFAPNASKFFGEGMRGFDRAIIMETYSKLPEKVAIALALNASKFFSDEMNFSDRLKIINAFSEKGTENSVLMAAKLMKDQKLSFSDKIKYVDFALTFCEFHDNNAVSILEKAEYFIKDHMSLNDISDIISLVSDIPKDIISDGKRIFAENMDWRDQMTVLYIMANVSNRVKSLGIAENYFTSNMSWITKTNLLLYLAKQTKGVDDSDPVIQEILNPEKQSQQLEDQSKLTPETRDLFDKYRESPSSLDEEFMGVDLSEFASPLPKTSIFADTDLVLWKDDFNGVPPLNAIKKNEFKEIEKLAEDIFAGNSKIKIDTEDAQFQKDAQLYIKTLLTRSVGRQLLRKVINNSSLQSVEIKFGERQRLSLGEEGHLSISLSPNLSLIEGMDSSTGKEKLFMLPMYLVLAHELIHASHFPNATESKKIEVLKYDDLEEQITISGFKKNIELPEESLEVDDGLFNEESFDKINERNLTAAFANSKQIFYPRVSHKGVGRGKTSQDVVLDAYPFMKQKISSRLIQQRLKAPAALKQTYYELIQKLEAESQFF